MMPFSQFCCMKSGMVYAGTLVRFISGNIDNVNCFGRVRAGGYLWTNRELGGMLHYYGLVMPSLPLIPFSYIETSCCFPWRSVIQLSSRGGRKASRYHRVQCQSETGTSRVLGIHRLSGIPSNSLETCRAQLLHPMRRSRHLQAQPRT